MSTNQGKPRPQNSIEFRAGRIVTASNDSITITIPETGDKFCLTVSGGSIHLESSFLKSLAS
jgi:hypothetical protein